MNIDSWIKETGRAKKERDAEGTLLEELKKKKNDKDTGYDIKKDSLIFR